MQGGWQPPPGGGGYGGGPPSGGYGSPPGGPPPGYGAPPPGAGPYAPPGAGFAPSPGITNYGTYEFSEMENQIIEKTASRAKTWGIISIVIGALQALVGLGSFAAPQLAGTLIQGIVSIIIGVTFLGAGNSLKAVVDTQGNDIPHMMTALQKIGSAFFIQIVMTIIAVVLVGLVLILVFFVAAASAITR